MAQLKAVHLTEGLSEITRHRIGGRRYPLGESPDFRTTCPSPERTLKAIEWLDVEHAPRYRATLESTYCNVYAHDFCYILNVYLPRVWWTPTIDPTLFFENDTTVNIWDNTQEMTSNALYYWLINWGIQFGWEFIEDLQEAQRLVNKGWIAVICARSKAESGVGHISLIIPEQGNNVSITGNSQFFPAQSQAGRCNFSYFIGNWWSGTEFPIYGVWVHGGVDEGF